MGKAAKQKGARGEREFSEVIREASGDAFTAHRGRQYCGGPNSPDIISSMPVHWEVKRAEKCSPAAFWAQAEADAGLDKEPAVAWKRNGGCWLAFVRAHHLIALHAKLFRLEQKLKELERQPES